MLPLCLPSAGCPAPRLHPGSSCSTIRTLWLQQKPNSWVGMDSTRLEGWPAHLFLSLGLSFFFCHLGWTRRAGRGLLMSTAEVEHHVVWNFTRTV